MVGDDCCNLLREAQGLSSPPCVPSPLFTCPLLPSSLCVPGPRHLISAVERVQGPGGEELGATLLQGSDDAGGGAAAAAERERAYWWGLFSTSMLFTAPVFFVAMIMPMLPGGAAGGWGWGRGGAGRGAGQVLMAAGAVGRVWGRGRCS